MDTFFEQLIRIKRTGATWGAYIGIAIATIIILAAAYFFIPMFFIIIAALTVFGAYKLYSMLSVEYEYIITNSTMDIDKIIAKSSRKRVISFELTAVERIEKYRKDLPADIIKDCIFACNRDDNAYVLVIAPEGKGKQAVVIAPDDRITGAMKTFLPRYVSESID